MKFPRRFRQKQESKPSAFSLVDIGRDTVKAVVLLRAPGRPELQVAGYGHAPTGGHDITGGRIEANAVTASVNAALVAAEDRSEQYTGQKIVPDDVIFALAGQATVGKLFRVRQTRPKPAEPISARELENLRHRAERLVRQGLASLPVEGGQWQALAVSDAGVHVDQHLVLDGVGLTGRDVSYSVFGVAGHAATLRALQVLAERLDISIANIVAAPQALATVAPHTEAIILDTGLSGTDVCLILDNALVAAAWIPFGGNFFTQTLSQGLDIPLAEADVLKQAWATGELGQTEAEQVSSLLDTPCRRWYKAVIESLFELAVQVKPAEELGVAGKRPAQPPAPYAVSEADRPLPRRIYLTGRGNLLPGLDKLLRSNSAPFQSVPEVIRLGQRPFPAIKDLTDSIDYDQFSLTLSLSAGLPDPA
jgi:cell division ATPase FtsA